MQIPDNENTNFPISPELKKMDVFKEVSVESGHPEITVENLTGKIEDMGYEVSSYGSSITNDDIAEGVKDFKDSLECKRFEKFYRPKAKEFKKYAWFALAASILFGIIIVWANFNSIALIFGIIFIIATIVLFFLAKPKDKFDTIWIKVEAKVYSGTKSREMRDSGKHTAGTTKTASSVYVHSEIKFLIGAESDIGTERVREDINTISKYLQKF